MNHSTQGTIKPGELQIKQRQQQQQQHHHHQQQHHQLQQQQQQHHHQHQLHDHLHNHMDRHRRQARGSTPFRLTVLTLALIVFSILVAILSTKTEAKGIHKRSFAGLGCLGVYDKAKFTRLDRVCEECYQLYREPDIHTACRQECFKNIVFTRCVDALLLTHESKKFDEMVEELYGK